MRTPIVQPTPAAPTSWTPVTWHGPVMALLGLLFFLRVIGQMLVTFGGVTWLPGEEHWQSGLLPYSALLASQLVILFFVVVVTRDVWRGQGPFTRRRPRAGRCLRWFGVVYALSMIIRYIVTMALVPGWRWFGHSIPTAFHLVLAAFLLVLSGLLLREGGEMRAER